jgi:glutamine synthetase
MAEVLGADLLELLIQQSEREIEFIANQVTPVEIERYLENF